MNLIRASGFLAGVRWLFCFAIFMMSSGCNSQSSSVAKPVAPASAPKLVQPFREHNVTIYGYNYTDTGIGSFEVNGQGGGNVMVSEMDSSGGSGVCCVTVFTPLSKPRPVTIKWTCDGDTWCEQEVTLAPLDIPSPKYFEVHFYPDGHIELAMTEESSDPRLKLARSDDPGRYTDEKLNINNDSKFARCKLGYR